MALRALAMTSKLCYRAYYPSLIRNLYLCPSHLTGFSQMLERDMDAGRPVQSLLLVATTDDSHDQISIPLSQLDTLVSSTSNQYVSYKAVPRSERKSYRDRAVDLLVISFFSKLKALQTLVIIRPNKTVELPRVERVEGIQVPLSFLINHLKQLQLGRSVDDELGLAANRAIWILCFCPHLRQAILRLSISTKSAGFLEEFHQTFNGLSNVKDLPLALTSYTIRQTEALGGDCLGKVRRVGLSATGRQMQSGTF